ncbi:MAG: SprT-like domain-containing protein [Gemmatimonadaceae bacterium]|nr:SprT-like domain-containing protein [Gemmatimonadaceae bacterium]
MARWVKSHIVDPLQLGLLWETPVTQEPSVAVARPAPSEADVAAAAQVRSGGSATDASAPARPRPRALPRPREAAAFLERLRGLGLHGISHLTLRRTRRVMVSNRGARLTVHADFAAAPEDVLRAIVRFVTARRRPDRLAAQRIILAYEVRRAPARRRAPVIRAADAPAVARLREAHARLNREHFGGALRDITVIISGRMKTRLGHYTPVQEGVEAAEIAISRRHIRRDGWREAEHTLLHEMVHQWQDESGLPIDHGLAFRRKAREVGVLPRAKRPVAR